MADFNKALNIQDGKRILTKFLSTHPDIKLFRVILVDLSGITRVTAIMPRPAFERAAEIGYINSQVSPIMASFSLQGGLNRAQLYPGVDELIFDWNSLKVCPYAPGHASIMTFAGATLDLDPRLHLSQMKSRPSFLIGHEVEFLLYKDPDFEGSPQYCTHMSTASLLPFTPILDEIVLGLEEAGIPVMKYHSEDMTFGFFEIALAPLEPLAAADALVYSHQAVRSVAHKHGYKATFSTNPFASGISIGSHMNISYNNPDSHEHLLAGLLEHIPAVCAFTMPTVESYGRKERLGAWVRWGQDNKAAVVRVKGPSFFELRCVDATTNPYLAAAAVITVLLHGEQSKTPLTILPLKSVAAEMSEETRKELKITKRLPGSLAESIAELEKDSIFAEALGSKLVDTFSTLKKAEVAHYKSRSAREQRTSLRNIF